jgi:hypothetical protein
LLGDLYNNSQVACKASFMPTLSADVCGRSICPAQVLGTHGRGSPCSTETVASAISVEIATALVTGPRTKRLPPATFRRSVWKDAPSLRLTNCCADASKRVGKEQPAGLVGIGARSGTSRTIHLKLGLWADHSSLQTKAIVQVVRNIDQGHSPAHFPDGLPDRQAHGGPKRGYAYRSM